MIKNILPKLKIIKATLNDYPALQNMARFYVYDMSRSCGFISEEWACPSNGLYDSHDFKIYFSDPTRQAFLVKVGDELAGFVLLNKIGTQPQTDWNMGEFFILAKFQGKGIGNIVTHEIWKMHPGLWEVTIIPENKPALSFWRKAVSNFTSGNYSEAIKDVRYDTAQPKRYILSFDTRTQIPTTTKNGQIKITFVDQISDELGKQWTDDSIAYETSHGVDFNHQKISLVISDEKDNPCGVLVASTAFAEIYVDHLWVDSAYRDRGYGKKLLQALEAHFKGRGFNNINLFTSTFQAPEFYKKCGFMEEFFRVNKINPKLSKTFFVKFFEEECQTQGLLNQT